jgi:signal transduction histidine kinase
MLAHQGRLNKPMSAVTQTLLALLFSFMPLALFADGVSGEARPFEIPAQTLETNEVITLDSKWEFYWRRLLEPTDFTLSSPLAGAEFLSPLMKWSRADSSLGISRHGFATYRLRFKTDTTAPVTLMGHIYRNSIKIWANGELAASRGTVGTSHDTSIPNEAPFFHTFRPQQEMNEIVLQMGSFHHTRGGGGCELMLGLQPKAQKWFENNLVIESLIIGSLLIMGFYHIGLWLLKRRNHDLLMFAGFCLMIAGRSLIIDEAWLLDFLVPDLSWTLLERLEYLTVSLSFPFLAHFIYALFPKEVGRNVVRLSWATGIFFSVEFLVLPPLAFAPHLLCLQIVILVAAVGCGKGIVHAIIRRRDGANTNFFGFMMLTLAFINDILRVYHVIDSVVLMPFGTILFVFFQATSLSIQFYRAFEGEAKARREFENLSTQLEKQVEERTKTIATIINNVRSGFFLMDERLNILPGFTQSCNRLLGLDLKVSRHLFDIFTFTERDRDNFEAGIIQIFEDVLPEAVSLANLATRLQRKGRIYEVLGSVVRDNLGNVSALLFSVSDITQLVSFEQENSKNRMLLRILNYKDAFRFFVADVYDRCLKAKDLLQKGHQHQVRQSLHTIKGNSALFELTEISSLVHEIEEHDTITVSDIIYIDRKFEGFLQENFKIIGFSLGDAAVEALVLHNVDVLQLKKSLSTVTQLTEIDTVFNGWYSKISSLPVASLLGPIERSIELIAEKIGKKVKFTLLGGDIKVDPVRYGDLMHNLIHLIRNALDHGIEDPASRSGKSLYGQIKMSFKDFDHALVIEVEDDGAGIDTDRLLASAIASGKVTFDETRSYNVHQILSLLFLPGLSNADKGNPSELSGRGYGMTAVKDAVVALGGTINIMTSLGIGTRFTIEIPQSGQQELGRPQLKASYAA